MYTLPEFISYDSFLEMAKPTQQHKSMVFYHGTQKSDSEIEDILKNGFDPKYSELKYDYDSVFKPVKDHIYMSLSKRTALTYACGGDYLVGSNWVFSKYLDKKRFKENTKAVVFEIHGDNLTDIYPDEDEIGHYLSELYKKKSYSFFEKMIKDFSDSVLSKDIIETLSETPSKIKAGKIIIEKATDDILYILISNGSNVANKGKLKPSKAYVLEFKEFSVVETVEDFYEIAKVIQI